MRRDIEVSSRQEDQVSEGLQAAESRGPVLHDLEQAVDAFAQHAKPLWDTLQTWLDIHRPGVPPQSALGRALAYLANEWDKLVVYLTDGRIPIDNNAPSAICA